MKRVNICIGRFQPFTAGHYKCIEAAWKQKRLPTVICMIDVPESKVDKRHPFPSDMLISSYSNLFENDSKIADVVRVKNADIVVIAEILNRLGYEIASWTCGTDRLSNYSKMAERYHDMAGLSDDFEMIEVVRTDEDISATKARSCLLNGDRNGFGNLMPNSSVFELDVLYQTLKSQIDKVYNVEERWHRFKLEARVRRLERLLLNKRHC